MGDLVKDAEEGWGDAAPSFLAATIVFITDRNFLSFATLSGCQAHTYFDT